MSRKAQTSERPFFGNCSTRLKHGPAAKHRNDRLRGVDASALGGADHEADIRE
jgi:hypothetical protein